MTANYAKKEARQIEKYFSHHKLADRVVPVMIARC